MWPAGDSERVRSSASMHPDSHDIPLLLVLASRSPGGRLTVDLQSFLHFSAEMDLKLEELERRWVAFRKPACRPEFARRRGDSTREKSS